MKTLALLLLAATPAKQNAPLPFTPQQQSEIGCIAVLGLLAYDQGRGLSLDYPDVRVRGKKWAGVTGDRIAFDSKQDAEVVAYAIKLAVKGEQDAVIKAADPKAGSTSRIDACLAMMNGVVASASPGKQRAVDATYPEITVDRAEPYQLPDGTFGFLVKARVVNHQNFSQTLLPVVVRLFDKSDRIIYSKTLLAGGRVLEANALVEIDDLIVDAPAAVARAEIGYD